MSETLIPTRPEWAKGAHVTREQYIARYAESITDPEQFWAREAEKFVWRNPWQRVKNTSFKKPVSIRWFEDGKLNITENCIDRHLPARANQTAIIWEGDDPTQSKHISYQTLFEEVCRFANALKHLGVKKGDCVTIYMPMIVEAAYAMLACARIGAVHSVVFGGFSAEALKGRIEGCNSKLVITADEGMRGGKRVPLKTNVDAATKGLDVKVLVVKNTGAPVAWNTEQDVWYHELRETASTECAAESMDAEDPLFILYTSGSTGKPKALLHTCGGYMVYASVTHKHVFDYRDGDIYWCTADIGWITGHSYVLYGPLLNGATTLMFEGVPNYPDFSRFWQVVDKHRVTIFYTAPTAIRALMREGDDWVKRTSRKSLRVLASVGEPINPEAWLWYYHVVGEAKAPVIDTWWQTETGGILIAPLPGATDLKPGSATLPFFGAQPAILTPEGNEQTGACEGMLCLKDSWPGQARTVFGDHARFEETYFSQYPGYYFTGDGARRDEDGYYWITGRVDDVLNVSGHRIGTADVESALVGHGHVSEAAVVGYPHDIKGQGIYCYVTLTEGFTPSEALEKELKAHVRKVIGPIATPDVIHFTPALPKTRSGKIMRRILRKIAAGDTTELGDTSTLLNPEVVGALIESKH